PDTLTLHSYPLSLHDALPISPLRSLRLSGDVLNVLFTAETPSPQRPRREKPKLGHYLGLKASIHGHVFRPAHSRKIEMLLRGDRSEEHTSELQSRGHLVCRLL